MARPIFTTQTRTSLFQRQVSLKEKQTLELFRETNGIGVCPKMKEQNGFIRKFPFQFVLYEKTMFDFAKAGKLIFYVRIAWFELSASFCVGVGS